MTLPEKDVPPREAVENWGDFIYVLARGRFATTQQNARACTWAYGTYQVNGNQLIMDNIAGGGIAPTGATIKGGERFVLSWSRYRDTVKLIPIDPPNIGLKPWHLISRRPSAAYFPRRCPPPAGALTG
jgi:hypothetical protein